ncbi:hypothetical protein [Promicromonospora soli]|uniref:Secreted protein n=1 Tax=Promicromonospora soli TaxID=2035533 RepID=A0A919G3F6_9MICO|nr:hypothetical protein [Promicromonospora soli]GHH76455.1 hypothetical protein GCM10017772_35160 [Promicromonospora soli]
MLKNRAIAQKLGSVMVAGLLVLSAGVAVAAAPASATSCNSWRGQKVNDHGLDSFRAGAACTEINSNHKVRAQLVRDAAKDKFSDYFTTENKSYYSVWVTCYAGCSDDYQVASR